MMFLGRAASCLAPLLLLLAACAVDTEAQEAPLEDMDQEQEINGDEGAVSSVVDCDRESMAAFQGGRSLGSMDVFTIGGKRVTLKTGHAFLKLQKEAAARGIDIWINSGFRTMEEQEHFYRCFQTRRCNNGNRAARPGFSNHQHGRALDIGTSNRSRLDRMIRELRLDWRQTVRGEAWHYEYFGPSVPGICDGNSEEAPAATGGCFSPTLGRHVDEKVCVEGRTKWFQCEAASWHEGGGDGTGPFGACAASHPKQ